MNVGVTVTDSHGRSIEGLRKDDFRVFDNGVERPLSGFVNSDEPAQIVLLIESSPSAYFLRGEHLAAAYRLVNALSPADRVAIVSYSSVPKLIMNFTPDKTAASAAIQDISVDYTMGNMGLNLSSSLAATLRWLETVPGEKTIVLLSTGIDTAPGDRQLMDRELQASDTRVLAISLLGDLRATPKELKHSSLDHDQRTWLQKGFADADLSMRDASEVTGGRVYFPRTANGLNDALADIVNLTRHEYLLSFDPSSRDGLVHSIKVKVKHSPRRVAYRQAYLAPPPQK